MFFYRSSQPPFCGWHGSCICLGHGQNLVWLFCLLSLGNMLILKEKIVFLLLGDGRQGLEKNSHWSGFRAKRHEIDGVGGGRSA